MPISVGMPSGSGSRCQPTFLSTASIASTKVAASERGRLVRWQDDFDGYQQLEPSSTPVVIEWRLSPGPGGTRLTLVHSGFGDGADWDEMYDGTKAGWTFFVWHLLEVVRHHLGQRRTVLFERRPSILSREKLGQRLFGPEGLALAPARPDAGSTAEISLGGQRTRFEVQYARFPRNLFGKLPDLGGALLLIEMEPGLSGPVQTGLWLSTWGLDARRGDALRTGLRSMADAVFGPPPG